MDLEGADYNEVLKTAQELGLAEADPAMDVDGTDAAQKLAILAHLSFGARVHWSDIPKRGIDDIQACDMAFAKQMGYRVKLIAYAKLVPTASAVVADIIDTAVGRTALTFNTLELWADGNKRVEFSSPGDLAGRFYMRFNVMDNPGVLGQVTSLLGQHGISIASVIQHEADEGQEQPLPLVIMTHKAKESAAAAAMIEISKLPAVGDSPERLRILS